MEELKKCGCGEIPEGLQVAHTATSKWAWVSGTCCGEWSIEFRTNYHDIESDECMKLAMQAWNLAPRKDEK